ncbi:MAG: hypothetical protein ACO3UU_10390 [Minisyncoccia bacterium]
MDIDEIISLLKFYTKFETFEDEKSEIGEQGEPAAAASTPSGGGEAYNTVTKWETGLTRSVANQIDYKVTWKSLNKLVRGKANTLL